MSIVFFIGSPGGGLQFSEDGLHVGSPKKFPPLELRVQERALFMAYYSLLWRNRRTIFSTPEMYDAPLSFSIFSCAFLQGGPLSLGVLLELWENGNWTVPCPECRGICRVVSWEGFLLSGINKWSGFCTHCGRNCDGCVDPEKDGISFVREALNARELRGSHRKSVVVNNPPVQSSFPAFSGGCPEKSGTQSGQGNQVSQKQLEEEKIILSVDDTKTLREVIEFLGGQAAALE